MGFEGKNHSSSSSEEDSDPHHQAERFGENAITPSASATSGGRFYECMYCKRGFNNAQALGGHMNIHRKEKAKVKLQKAAAKQQQSAGKSSDTEDFASGSGSTSHGKFFLTDQYYEAPVGRQMTSYNNHQFFPGSNPSYDLCDFLGTSTRKKEKLGLFDQDLNLSVQIGHNHSRDVGEIGNNKNNTWKENEVDLELRLGVWPCN